jgi:uridine kinase
VSPATLADISRAIRALPRDAAVLVAIDGRAGAGKSELARSLSESLGGAPVAETDDFATWDDPFGWGDRFEAEVIEPLLAGRAARYMRSDWTGQCRGAQVVVEPAPVVIIEGVSAARRAWSHHLAYSIWVETPKEVRLARGLERDGQNSAQMWDAWMTAEDEHFACDRAWERADIVVRGDE